MKATHMLSFQPTGRESKDPGLRTGPICVYGEDDLKARLKAAKEEGRKATVRKL